LTSSSQSLLALFCHEFSTSHWCDFRGWLPDDLNNSKIDFENPALLALSSANEAAQYALFDLGMHLVLSNGERHFITSDNPVVLYNQYYEGMKDMSFTGFVNTGLQIFIPLSPHCLLILYDKNIYHIKDNSSGITKGLSSVDLRYINLLQFVNADQNVFFDALKQINDLEKLNLLARGYRKNQRAKTLVFDEEKADVSMAGSSLLQGYVEDLNIGLNLEFMKLKRSTKKLSMKKRLANRFRKEIPPQYLPYYEEPPNMPQKFIRRKANSE